MNDKSESQLNEEIWKQKSDTWRFETYNSLYVKNTISKFDVNEMLNKARQQGRDSIKEHCRINCKEQYDKGRAGGYRAGLERALEIMEQGKFDKKMDKLIGRKEAKP
jgi:hypothetical protein